MFIIASKNETPLPMCPSPSIYNMIPLIAAPMKTGNMVMKGEAPMEENHRWTKDENVEMAPQEVNNGFISFDRKIVIKKISISALHRVFS